MRRQKAGPLQVSKELSWAYGFLVINAVTVIGRIKSYKRKISKSHKNCAMLRFTLFCCGYMMTSSNGNIFALLAICAGNSPLMGEFPAQRPVTQSFDVFFDLRPNKQWWGWWVETPSRPLWHHCNDMVSCRWMYVMFYVWSPGLLHWHCCPSIPVGVILKDMGKICR